MGVGIEFQFKIHFFSLFIISVLILNPTREVFLPHDPPKSPRGHKRSTILSHTTNKKVKHAFDGPCSLLSEETQTIEEDFLSMDMEPRSSSMTLTTPQSLFPQSAPQSMTLRRRFLHVKREA